MEDEGAKVTLTIKPDIVSFGFINDGFIVIAKG